MRAVCCPSQCLEQVRAHVISCYPHEGCGLLIGSVDASQGLWRITRIQPVKNLAVRRDRFELDPAVRLSVQRELRDNAGAEAIIGHFHSHPQAAAEPSACDQQRAEELGLVWMIVSVAQNPLGEIFCPAMACFVATENGLQEYLVELSG